MTPGVMAQGLGGSSVVVSEGLSAFHNPANVDTTIFSFALSRWLYGTNYLTVGGAHNRYSFGLAYLNYGQIHGFDEVGNPTNVFVPYDMCAAVGCRFGIFGIALKGFTEHIEDHNLYGVAGCIGMHVQRNNLTLGAKIDNLGKEFSESTTIPYYAALGLKYDVTSELGILIEAKGPDIEVSSGISYAYATITLLLGARYVQGLEPVGRHAHDIGFTGGVVVSVDDYRIGYSIVYGYSSVAHQFSVTFRP